MPLKPLQFHMKVIAKVKTKYVTKNDKAVLNILISPFQDMLVKSGQVISICPTDRESVEVNDVPVGEPPYWVKEK